MAHRWSGNHSREKSDGLPETFDALCNIRVGVSHAVGKMSDDLQSIRVIMSAYFLTVAKYYIFGVCL